MQQRNRLAGLASVNLWVATLIIAALAAACVPYTPTQGGAVRTAAQAQPTAAAQARTGPALSTDVRVVATEFAFAPNVIRVPVGQKVKVTLENKGVIEHDYVLEAAGTDLRLLAGGGKTASGEFTFSREGEFDVICSIPGHKEAGMRGKLIVGQPAAAAQPAAQAAAQPTAPAAAQPLPPGLKPLQQPLVAPPVTWRDPRLHQVEIESREVTALLADGVGYTFWTFGGTVPGPMLRVRQGDTVELTFKNAATSKVTHSIDLHAVTGPGGGARATQVPPGGSAAFRFKALNPGVYVYHCATPMVAHHIASGMYGLIVVEPPEGLPRVDREFYVMQGDFYLKGTRGDMGGLREFSLDKMLAEQPDYVLFNGGVGALTKESALRARVGETVRLFFGVGGPNLTSSFHVIGEIFDRVYPEGATEPLRNVQTTLVPTGGATIVDFKVEVPGTYILVDHSLGRLEKGGAALLEVEGAEDHSVFHVDQGGAGGTGGH